MADFEIAYNRTGNFEKGYQCYEDDNGNWTGGEKGVGILVGTKDGITAPELMAFLKRVPTVDDMKNLGEATKKSIYKNNYWLPIRGDEIQNQKVANELYDSAVNIGVRGTIKLAQRDLNVYVSGKMDTPTLISLNRGK